MEMMRILISEIVTNKHSVLQILKTATEQSYIFLDVPACVILRVSYIQSQMTPKDLPHCNVKLKVRKIKNKQERRRERGGRGVLKLNSLEELVPWQV